MVRINIPRNKNLMKKQKQQKKKRAKKKKNSNKNMWKNLEQKQNSFILTYV